MRVDRKGARVRKDYWRAAEGKRIPHGIGAHMRDIDKHAETIHLVHHLLAEAAQSVVLGPVRRRISPVDIVPVGKRHVTRAQFVESSQDCRRIFHHVTAFNPEEAGNATGLVDPLDVVGRARLLEPGLAANHAQGHIKFAHRLVQRRVGSLRSRFDEDGPVLPADAAFPEARNVSTQTGLDFA